MPTTSADVPADRLAHVRQELQRLRQGPSLAHPGAVRGLSEQVRRLARGPTGSADTATEVLQVVGAIRGAIKGLDRHLRQYALVDFNLDEQHAYPTLTERQESLASSLKCASKTVRRNADKALETVALQLVSGSAALGMPAAPMASAQPAVDSRAPTAETWRAALCDFWGLRPAALVDIVCSEIPDEERPSFASPVDRNYLRYAKFADLDSLVYVRSHVIQLLPSITVRDFSPSEYFDTSANTLIVLGGPPWNAKFREFQAGLPFFFEPHPLGEDDPLVVPLLGDRKFGPRWTPDSELLTDVTVFVRLTLGEGMRVFLAAGCLTLGVLGAAKSFLQGERGAKNVAYVDGLIGGRDFVLVAEANRVGGITDIADLTTTGPTLLLARGERGRFEVVVDQTEGKDYQPTR